MRRLILFLVFFLWMVIPGSVSAQDADSTPSPTATAAGEADPLTPQPAPAAIGITFPQAGEIVKGSVPISGLITQPGFSAWELAFSPIDNPTGTWFLLATGSETLEGQIYTWDTTSLTDGDYALRLRVRYSDAYREALVAPVRIRNYSVENSPTPSPTDPPTDTPTATARSTLLIPTSTATSTPRPTPRSLPPNPATLENGEIFASLLQGAGYVGLAFLLFGILSLLKSKLSKKK
ncbi:MAG: hypothetical protein CVU44_13745 [Chloroflexi bacterium HGW-Chloroflexi-6]|nr:MAG: hypothetical protein CVU44_13745 [Chloroflexi bacterium HGW-Chloroflexi-6]